MFKVLTLNKIAQCGIQEFPTAQFSVSSEEKNPEGILVRSQVIPQEEINAELLAVARAGAGTNNIPVDYCTEKGIVVFNAPGANANAVKELALTGMLLASRNIVGGINWVQGLAGQTDVAQMVEKGKSQFVGPELAGKTLGVIGLGATGILAANASCALGMKVIGYDPYVSVDFAWNLSPEVQKAPDLDTVFAESDYITLHLPANAKTKGMFNDETFAKCKKGLRLINISRAELVDDAAVKKAIADGIVACYVTDFPNEEMLGNEKIVPIPHLGASSPESEDNCATMASAQLRDYLLYGNIKNSVNFPNCEIPYVGKKRVCVVHRNEANVMADITGLFAGKGANVANMVSNSKGDFAYTILDVNGDVPGGIADELAKLDNVIKVRVI